MRGIMKKISINKYGQKNTIIIINNDYDDIGDD